MDAKWGSALEGLGIRSPHEQSPRTDFEVGTFANLRLGPQAVTYARLQADVARPRRIRL